jgi:hypothetical protein
MLHTPPSGEKPVYDHEKLVEALACRCADNLQCCARQNYRAIDRSSLTDHDKIMTYEHSLGMFVVVTVRNLPESYRPRFLAQVAKAAGLDVSIIDASSLVTQ